MDGQGGNIANRALLEPWGKARPDARDSNGWHPLIYHCLDVAAVAMELLERRPITRARAAWLLGLPEEVVVPMLVRLAALHDIGKLAPAFQAKAEPRGWRWPTRIDAALALRGRTEGHPADAQLLWEGRLHERFGHRLWPDGETRLELLMPAVFGHHGRPVQHAASSRYSCVELFGVAACELAEDYVAAVVELVPQPTTELPAVDLRRVRRASWWVAGLVTVSDWVGSNEGWFPYTSPFASESSLAGYWALARSRATRAVEAAGLAPCTPCVKRGYEELAGITFPTPLQRAVEEVPLGEGPILAIVEDATGAGKSEAAQMFVHRLMADGRASGAYWAMPTKATANAMYERQAHMLRGLFNSAAGGKPSLVLAHGGARLHEGFRATVLHEEHEPLLQIEHDPLDELPSEAACAAFLADDRRAGLLADLGVGTVDQAFLGVLPVRFSALRLFALAEKVLVIDEVHAFDEYMRSEAEGLLRAHAALGGSAVLLSATLTTVQRTKLVQAWRASLDASDEALGSDTAMVNTYPLLTIVRDAGKSVEARSVESPHWTRRTVPVRWISSDAHALERVMASARAGACVAWIRNTVGACIRSAAQLEESGLQPLVFHARFAPGDRQRIEGTVLQRFGKRSTLAERRGQVLVATQVVEQSLDLDFDVMITDLAPVDLLIQRAGRLWRHERVLSERTAGGGPELAVLAGPLHGEVDADWVSALGTHTEWVYRDPGVLWRSAHALDEAGGITAPAGVRQLVEAAYGNGAVPESFRSAMERASGEASAARGIANQNVQRLERSYGDVATLWSADATYPTRLGDETMNLRLARLREDGAIEPWESDERLPLWQRWAMSDISIRTTQLRGATRVPPQLEHAVEPVRLQWGRFEQGMPVLVLQQTSDPAWRGILVGADGREVTLQYSERLGLLVAQRQ